MNHTKWIERALAYPPFKLVRELSNHTKWIERIGKKVQVVVIPVD